MYINLQPLAVSINLNTVKGFFLRLKRQGGGGKQKKRREDNIKEWTGMDFASSSRAAENRTR